jgi:hypothetical protein
MTVTEAQIQAAVQATIQGISAYTTADVRINDWSFLDGPKLFAPYVIIVPADNFRATQDTVSPNTTREVPLWLIESFTDWKESYDNFVIRRQALIDEFNEVGTNRSPAAGGNVLVSADAIRNDGPVVEWYDKLIPPELQAEAMPDYVVQRIIMEVRVFG